MSFSGGAQRIRRGSLEDVSAVLALFDEAVEWLVARGQTGQWGSKPFSENPSAVDRVRGWACGNRFWIAEKDTQPVGTLVLADAPSYAQPAEPDEAYIMVLLTSRRHAGERIGSQLVDQAIHEAQRGRHPVLRVDCWAGAPGLVNWYEQQGFSRTRTFELGGWVGQIFRMPLPPAPPADAG